MQLARWHALGQEEDNLSNRSNTFTVHEALLRIRQGIVAASPRREGSCRLKDEAAWRAANEMVRGRIAFVGKEIGDYLRAGESG